ncbi:MULTISPECIES: LptF/LptG family permease [unclassified Fibrobacter]|uniref:LptF/LptG family permease n=1 Tax=unclassified Fibrobacter TaxID=2634177 RepID=UPI000D6C843C|nr:MULTISPECIES: LptF/LptG family permease [unclassified Fibrobacter]PWJ66206.1 lipopolysaccharide export system permease protein [Fibrobacter sp. UWR4]PZW69410.1 lipopolysaccharide export system permease protein [Fibrobacter sp. UWR1]
MKFSRYLMWNFLKMFLIVLLGAVLMFAVIDFVGNIKTWLARDTKDAIDYYVSYIPYMVYLITPVALFIAVLASVGNMARHLEMSAMQSSGQSPFKTLIPIFVFGILMSVASYEMSEIILPDANHRRLEIMETNAQKKKNPRIKEKQDFTFIDSERASWFFKYYSGKSRTGRDVVLLIRNQGRLEERIDARVVRWVEKKTPGDSSVPKIAGRSEGCWLFDRGYLRELKNTGEIVAHKLRNETLCGKVSTHPDDLINERQISDEMDSKMVKNRIEVLKRSGEDVKAMETALHFKRSAHWMNLIVLLIGAALCHRYSRSGGLSQKFGVGLLIVFSYYIVERIGLKMGENGALTPFWAAWISHFIYGGVASVMLYRSFRL